MYGPVPGPTPHVPPPLPPAPAYPQPDRYGAYPAYPPGPAHAWHPTAPGPYPGYAVLPQRRRTAARVGLFLLRAFLTCLPLASVGLLCWAPLVRVVLVRRRVQDWVALSVAVLATVTAFFVVSMTPDDDNPASNAAITVMLLLSAFCTVYFLVAELNQPPRPVAQQPPYYAWPVAAPTPLVPIGQVQAELDELSALLRSRHERPAP